MVKEETGNRNRGETKEEKKGKERERGQRFVLGRERAGGEALWVGLCEVYSPSALLHGLELAASARVN